MGIEAASSLGDDLPAVLLIAAMNTMPLYFFALQTEHGLKIDSLAHHLDDSSAYEMVDVERGLIAWDELGTPHIFEPRREREGAGWKVRIGTTAPDELAKALSSFLLKIMESRRHRAQARAIGVSRDTICTASLHELIEFARKMNLVDEY